MNFKKNILAAITVLAVSNGFVHAQTEYKDKNDADALSLKAAQDQLAASFSGMTITGFNLPLSPEFLNSGQAVTQFIFTRQLVIKKVCS